MLQYAGTNRSFAWLVVYCCSGVHLERKGNALNHLVPMKSKHETCKRTVVEAIERQIREVPSQQSLLKLQNVEVAPDICPCLKKNSSSREVL